jgi:mono/diheme cytochrome c family protein
MVIRLLVLASVSLLVACQSPPTYMPSGEPMYKQYCASCHGADAKGHGPMASRITTSPPDLTTLANRHSGKFPYDYVSSVLEFGPAPSRNILPEYAYPTHGSSDMPTWGPIFQYYDKQNERVVQQRIKNLCDYLATLQEHL